MIFTNVHYCVTINHQKKMFRDLFEVSTKHISKILLDLAKFYQKIDNKQNEQIFLEINEYLTKSNQD